MNPPSAPARDAALGTAVAGLLWILHSEDRTGRLALIRTLRNLPGHSPQPPGHRD